jgi:hypothetical protein
LLLTEGCLLTSSFDGLGPPADGGAAPGVPGVPAVLAKDQAAPKFLALTEDQVYWTDGDPTRGALRRAPKSGGAVVDVVGGLHLPYGLAVDGEQAYIGSAVDQTVARCSLAGCATPQTLASGLDEPYGIAVDSARVYWVDSSASNDVRAVDKTSGAMTTLARDQSYSHDIALDDQFAYWTNSGGSVARADKTGAGGAMLIADGQNGPHGIALDAATVYFTLWDEGSIKAVAKSGGMVSTLATGRDHPEGIAVDGSTIYWVDQGAPGGSSGALLRCELADCHPEQLAGGLAEPLRVAVDAAFAYVSETGAGRVLQIAK